MVGIFHEATMRFLLLFASSLCWGNCLLKKLTTGMYNSAVLVSLCIIPVSVFLNVTSFQCAMSMMVELQGCWDEGQIFFCSLEFIEFQPLYMVQI